MKELAVSAIGATGNVGCSNDIYSFLSQFFIYALPLHYAKERRSAERQVSGSNPGRTNT